MVFKCTYKLNYIIDKNPEELLVEVELKMTEGLLKPMQNVYYGDAKVNGKPYTEIDLSHCVNAGFAAEEIGIILKNELIAKSIEAGKLFKVKKEEIK